MDLGSLEKGVIPGLERGKHKMSLEHLVETQSKKLLWKTGRGREGEGEEGGGERVRASE